MKTIKNIVLTSALSLVFVGCAGDRYHRSTGAYFDDKATTVKVKTDLFSDPIVHGHDVKIEVYQGKVQLAGFVDTQQQKDRAGEVARRVNGVQWVKNDLIVKCAMPGNPTVVAGTAPTAGVRTTSSSSVNEPAGAPTQSGGAKAGVNVGPIGVNANAGGGSGVGAGAHVGPIGAGANVGGGQGVNINNGQPNP